MSEKRRILELIDRAYTAKAWHGPALLEALAGVSAAHAAKHPVRGAHSIWELVEHVASWNEIVTLRLAGERPTVGPEWNFPPITRTTPTAWKASLRRLTQSQTRFRAAVASFPAAKLARRAPGMPLSWNVLIHGQVQHQLYHAGQIVLLRRGLGIPVA